jgi:hypothetical protein
MKHSSLPFPALSIACVGLAYVLLGWRLCNVSAFWLFNSWVIAVITIFVLTWWGNTVGGLVQTGARSLIAIFVLSIGLTLAIAYAEVFALGLILILTVFWGRLELQIRGMNRRFSLLILSVVVGISLALGWLLGHNTAVIALLQSPAHWIEKAWVR